MVVTTAQQMLDDAKTKIEVIRMQMLKVQARKDRKGSADKNRSSVLIPGDGLSNTNVDGLSPLEIRIDELRHRMQIEKAITDGAGMLLKQAQAQKNPDKKLIHETQLKLSESQAKYELLSLSLSHRLEELSRNCNSDRVDQLRLEIKHPNLKKRPVVTKAACLTGKLQVRLVGVQGLLEDIPWKKGAGDRRNSNSVYYPTDSNAKSNSLLRSSKKASSIRSKNDDKTSNEISAVLKLDNQQVDKTQWKNCSQQCWDQKFEFNLDKSRELEISIFWRDMRQMCAVKVLRLEDFLDDEHHGMMIHLEPEGILFAEIFFINPTITRRPGVKRQKKILPKDYGKNLVRPPQINTNVATWSRFMKTAKQALPQNCHDSLAISKPTDFQVLTKPPAQLENLFKDSEEVPPLPSSPPPPILPRQESIDQQEILVSICNIYCIFKYPA